MAEKITLNKTVYNKQAFDNTINTSFEEVVTSPAETQQTITVSEFFDNYQQIFYNIPAEGGSNSHAYLAETSGQYAGIDQLQSIVEPLIQEIDNLRAANLELEKRLAELTNTNTQQTTV